MKTKEDNLIDGFVKRNEEDIIKFSKMIVTLDKIKCKNVSKEIQNIIVDEILRLVEQNKRLRELKND